MPFIPWIVYGISGLIGSVSTFVFLRMVPIPWYYSPFILWGIVAALSALMFGMIGAKILSNRKVAVEQDKAFN
jgi:hypothetical protein